MENLNKMVNSKNAFWQAFIFSIIVFGIGLILGFFLEVRQSDNIFLQLVDSEINILDENLRTRIISDFDVGCDLAKQNLFSFAGNIYEEALELEEADTSGRLTDLTVLHKRYDLLRTLLWLESRELKERCSNDFKTLVYLYEYNSEDVDVSSKQNFYSQLLFDLKTEFSEEVLLIPIAIDTGLSSVELIINTEELGENNFPLIILDDGTIVREIITLDELKKLVF